MLEKVIAIVTLCFALLAVGLPAWSQQPENEGAQLVAVVNAIRDSLKEAQTNNVQGFPPLKSVTITLQTVAVSGGGGQLNFLIFALGAKYENETASTLKLVMTPPTTLEAPSVSAALDETKVKLALARAINLAKIGVLEANKARPHLRMSDIELELKFAVEVTGSGEVKFTRLLPLGLEGTAKLASIKIHSIKLRFGI